MAITTADDFIIFSTNYLSSFAVGKNGANNLINKMFSSNHNNISLNNGACLVVAVIGNVLQ